MTVTFYTRLDVPSAHKICTIKQVSPWGCHLLAQTKTGWIYVRTGPSGLRNMAVDTATPAPAAAVAMLDPQSHFPSIYPASTFQAGLPRKKMLIPIVLFSWRSHPLRTSSTVGKVSGPVWLDLSAEVLLFCLSYLKRQREREEREGKGSHIIMTDNRMQNCTFYSWGRRIQ